MFAVPSQHPAVSVTSDGSSHDHLASSTLLSNVCHVMDVSAIAWRVYRFPSPDLLLRSLSTAPAAPLAAVSAFHTPLLRAQHALRSVWASSAGPSEGLFYSVQQVGAVASSSSLLLFVCHIRSTSAEPVKLLPGEELLSQYAADADELSVPLSFSARLFSPAFSASVLSLLSAALTDTVLHQRAAALTAPSIQPPAMRFMLLGSCLCAAILPLSTPPPSSSKRQQLAAPPTPAAARPLPPSAAARPVSGTAVPVGLVSPSAYLSPPDTSQSSLPSPDPSDAADMVDDTAAAATTAAHSPRPLSTAHTKPVFDATIRLVCSLPSRADSDADGGRLPPLPSYLAQFVNTGKRGSAYRSPHTRQSSVDRSEERLVQLKPDVLADLALSVNTFPSLASLSIATRRSLAIANADDSTSTSLSSVSSTPAYTLQSADSAHLLGPPPLSAAASSALSPNTPGSMPALSPLVDDDGKLSPRCADNTASSAPTETVQQLPFAPWTLDIAQAASDAMDMESEVGGSLQLPAHFIRFIQQQTLAPLFPAFLHSTSSTPVHAVCHVSSQWRTVQQWLSGCSLLTRAFSRCRPFPLLAKQLSLPAFEQRKHPLSLHESPVSSVSSPVTASPLPLVSLPPPRLVFGLESELRDVPASAASLYTQSNLRPAITAKDALYAIAMPPNDAAAEDKRVDVWFDAFSAAYENGGLGRHRPLSGQGRSGVLKLRSVYEVLKERAEASVSAPATPASPADSGTPSNTASPRASSSSMILLSSQEPTTSQLALPLSRSLALHSTAAADGMRRYYQSIVAAVLAELDGISKGQGAEQLDRYDALILYIVVDDKLQLPHDVRHMSDYLSCLYFDRHSGSSFAAALSQLEQMDVVIRLLPSSTLSSFSSSTFTSLSLSVYSSIRRLLDRVDSDSDVELPKHVEQLYEPVTYIAGKRLEGKDDAMVEAASGTCTVVCVWTVSAGCMVACACDERGQVMESFVRRCTATMRADVLLCWVQCVQTVWTMARRQRPVQQYNVTLVQWSDETTSTATSAEYEREWGEVLTEFGYPSLATDPAAPLSPMTDIADTARSPRLQPARVTVCSLSLDAAFSVVALHDANTPSTSTTLPTAASSSSSTSTMRQPLVVEGINSASTTASHFLPLPPHTLCSPVQRRVPVGCGLLFPHRAADAARSTLARPVPSPLPAHTPTPLLLSLHDPWSTTASAASQAALLSSVAEQLQRLSFAAIPPLPSGGAGEGERGAAMDVDIGAAPLPVCIVERLTRLLSLGRASAT